MSEQVSIVFTESAAAKVWELLQEEENPNLRFRAHVTGGGCSGLQYGFGFDDKINDDDIVIVKTIACGKNVDLLVDSLSFTYLSGAEIDYQDDLEGARFIIRNPNAKGTCGCGSSFAV